MNCMNSRHSSAFFLYNRKFLRISYYTKSPPAGCAQMQEESASGAQSNQPSRIEGWGELELGLSTLFLTAINLLTC